MLRESGESVVTLHSKMDGSAQDAAINSFVSGSMRHLSFITIVSEGFDAPIIDAIVLLRPTRSPVRYVQPVGRGIRPYPGKVNCFVLDFGRVVENCGPLDDPIIRTKGEARASTVEEGKDMRFCPGCYFYHLRNVPACPQCGHTYTAEERDPTKNLTVRPGTGALLKEQSIPEWVDIQAARAEWHKSKAGNDCVKVLYYPKNIMMEPYKDYFVMGDANFLKLRLEAKVHKAFGLRRAFDKPADLLAALQLTISSGNYPRRIQVARNGQFMEILRYEGRNV